MENNELMHYGVLGMKWGVRRARRTNQRIDKRASRKNWSADNTNARKLKNKKVSQMSNQELKQLNERVRLEQEYSRLNPSKIKKGITFATSAAALMGTAISLYNNSSTIIKVGKKALGK